MAWLRETAMADEFLINTTTAGDQEQPADQRRRRRARHHRAPARVGGQQPAVDARAHRASSVRPTAVEVGLIWGSPARLSSGIATAVAPEFRSPM